MTRLRMTKAVLTARRQDLSTYVRALPSLELKRRQLLAELTAERAECERLDARIEVLERDAEAVAPAADGAESLEGLMRIARIVQTRRARLGLALPVLGGVEWAMADYSLVDRPPWVDGALEIARAITEATLERRFARDRAAVLSEALARSTQRINLLQQRLVPEARRDIARIVVFLADGERTAVARAKLARRRRADRGQVSA